METLGSIPDPEEKQHNFGSTELLSNKCKGETIDYTII